MGSLHRIGVIFRKELVDNLRDRRSIISSLVSALIGPAIIILMIVLLGKTIFSNETNNRLLLPVKGAENAPTLIQFLESHGVQTAPAPSDLEGAVRNGDVQVVLVIPPEYGENFRNGLPAEISLVLDTSRTSSVRAINRIRSLLNAYSSQIAVLRLMARGVSPVVIEPLAIEQVDVATPQSQVLIFLNMMPYFIILVVFIGGMYVIIDTTAGERERGSLEPLLINPVARSEFVLGKIAAALPFAIVTLLLTLLAFAVGFNAFPLEDYVGFQVTIDLSALAGIFLIALPMILFATSLQMIVATFTRSFKEAQTYVAFLPFIPALPGIGIAFLPTRPAFWNMLIPTFGQQLLINQLMRGETLNPVYVLITSLITILVAVLLILIAIRLYQRERILFGTR